MSDRDWQTIIYPPPHEGWPYLVASKLPNKEDPDVQFAKTVEDAEKLKAQIQLRLWRAKNIGIE